MSFLGLRLTPKDFQIVGKSVYVNTALTKNKPGMLLIYANWCGHCVRFKPTFNELCRKLGDEFPCSSIDIDTIDDALTQALDFQGVPTLKFFDQYGRIIKDYKGDRSTSSILSHVCKIYHHCVLHH
jgi:thiol-disulfide isomerase/thioredoxin